MSHPLFLSLWNRCCCRHTEQSGQTVGFSRNTAQHVLTFWPSRFPLPDPFCSCPYVLCGTQAYGLPTRSLCLHVFPVPSLLLCFSGHPPVLRVHLLITSAAFLPLLPTVLGVRHHEERAYVEQVCIVYLRKWNVYVLPMSYTHKFLNSGCNFDNPHFNKKFFYIFIFWVFYFSCLFSSQEIQRILDFSFPF